MPFYIANGKTARAEMSVKVFVHTDREAFLLAKEKMAVVASMERIEGQLRGRCPTR